MTKLEIHLEPNSENRNIYFPGHLLKGYVELNLDHSKKLRGCYLIVHGHARAHWKEHHSSGKSSHTVSYEGLEIYINTKIYLFGNSGAEAIEIGAGIHRFNFSCELPYQLPYSMHTSHGEIMYFVKAVLDIPWAFDKECQIPFLIVRYEDLNLYPRLRLPLDVDKLTTFFLDSEPLKTTISLPYTGFAIGQKIPIKIKYLNQGTVSVKETEIKLKRLISFTSQTPHVKVKTEKQMMSKVVTGGVESKSSIEHDCYLEIPKIALNSNGLYCRVVRVEYFLKIEAHVGMFHNNVKIVVPITIGSSPITMHAESYVQENLGYPIAPSIYSPTAPEEHIVAEDDFPPSFEEAIGTSQNGQEQNMKFGWNI
ncbi:hypothetical protein PVAND_006103 [Polypedilum vanderplanki]|uniref:Arrestin C-terminal-like domain-containing protein n=1 Tax=Polypedilum vanderplanki TaxID=319348 RepID=A0A9J6C2J7_POLVA|nr:hypothetical protein PVAND_006103 [Polypedilum vanderplanki]